MNALEAMFDEDDGEGLDLPPCTTCQGQSWSKDTFGRFVCEHCGTQNSQFSQTATSEVGESQTLRLSGRIVSRTPRRTPARGTGAGGVPLTGARRVLDRMQGVASFTLTSFLSAFQAILVAQVKALTAPHSDVDPTPLVGCPKARLWEEVGAVWLRFVVRWQRSGWPMVRVVDGRVFGPTTTTYAQAEDRRRQKEQEEHDEGGAEGDAGSERHRSDSVLSAAHQPVVEEEPQMMSFEHILSQSSSFDMPPPSQSLSLSQSLSQSSTHSVTGQSLRDNGALATTPPRQAQPACPISMALTLSILNWALRRLQAGVVASDLSRWASSALLPYLNVLTQPDVLPEHVQAGVGVARAFFSPRSIPPPESIEWLTEVLAADLGLTLSPLNVPAVAQRFVERLLVAPPPDTMRVFLAVHAALPRPAEPRVPQPRGEARQPRPRKEWDTGPRIAAMVIVATRCCAGWREWAYRLCGGSAVASADASTLITTQQTANAVVAVPAAVVPVAAAVASPSPSPSPDSAAEAVSVGAQPLGDAAAASPPLPADDGGAAPSPLHQQRLDTDAIVRPWLAWHARQQHSQQQRQERQHPSQAQRQYEPRRGHTQTGTATAANPFTSMLRPTRHRMLSPALSRHDTASPTPPRPPPNAWFPWTSHELRLLPRCALPALSHFHERVVGSGGTANPTLQPFVTQLREWKGPPSRRRKRRRGHHTLRGAWPTSRASTGFARAKRRVEGVPRTPKLSRQLSFTTPGPRSDADVASDASSGTEQEQAGLVASDSESEASGGDDNARGHKRVSSDDSGDESDSGSHHSRRNNNSDVGVGGGDSEDGAGARGDETGGSVNGSHPGAGASPTVPSTTVDVAGKYTLWLLPSESRLRRQASGLRPSSLPPRSTVSTSTKVVVGVTTTAGGPGEAREARSRLDRATRDSQLRLAQLEDWDIALVRLVWAVASLISCSPLILAKHMKAVEVDMLASGDTAALSALPSVLRRRVRRRARKRQKRKQDSGGSAAGELV